MNWKFPGQSRSLLVLCATTMLCAAAAWGEDSAALAAARRALAEALPQVAVQKIKTTLATASLPAAEREPAQMLLAEALLAARQYDDALTAIQPLADRGDVAARLLRAKALVGAGRWNFALPIFRELADLPDAVLAAHLGEAECWQGLGNTGKAIEVLESVVAGGAADGPVRLRLASLLVEARNVQRARTILATVQPAGRVEQNWAKYLDARLLLLEDQPAPALAAFDELSGDHEGLSESLVVGAALGATEARVALQGYDAADKALETFIWRNPENPYLEQAFRRLDQIYAQQENPGEGELQKWAAKAPPRRAALARYYVARLQIRGKKQEKAEVSLDAFVQTYPTHPLLPHAQLMRADLLLEKGDLAAAVRALEAAERGAGNDELRAEIQFRTGLVLDRQGQYLLAGNEFDRAGERMPKLRESALFNSALAALHQQNYGRFLEVYGLLSRQFPESPLRGEIMIEQGLAQARVGAARARESLQFFLNHFPLHARAPEAQLALGELAYRDGDFAATARYLQVANEAVRTPETAEQAQYFSIFAADPAAGGEESQSIARALDFIRNFPQSTLLPEVRMKLGQIYFRESDFPSAETQLATLARESPTSMYAEAALFLAGEAAMKSINPGAVDRALQLFDEVVKREGPFKLYARQQQAIVQSKLGKETEAVILYEAILQATPPPEPELRFAALCGQGDNLLIAGRKEPARLHEAVQVFDQLATLPAVPVTWRNQALYKKARALEQLEKTPEALSAYYDVLDRSEAESREFFWYYKAGFDAARIFEQKEDWSSAIGIYEKMARLDGPRAAESKAAARQLRLVHFIWE